MAVALESMGIGQLARLAGVSVQHCRDLEAAGVLPAVARSVGGHRRYTEHHLLALLAYEALAAGHGFSRARGILTRATEGFVDEALELLDERHATIHRQREETRATLIMLRELQADDEPQLVGARASIGEVARRIGASVSTLRHWENEGLVASQRDARNGYRRYDRQSFLHLRVVRMLRNAGYTIEQVRGVMTLLQHDRPERAFELAEQRLRELAGASRAALAGEAALWKYLRAVSDVEVLRVGAHILYG